MDLCPAALLSALWRGCTAEPIGDIGMEHLAVINDYGLSGYLIKPSYTSKAFLDSLRKELGFYETIWDIFEEVEFYGATDAERDALRIAHSLAQNEDETYIQSDTLTLQGVSFDAIQEMKTNPEFSLFEYAPLPVSTDTASIGFRLSVFGKKVLAAHKRFCAMYLPEKEPKIVSSTGLLEPVKT